jgi:hypothetical protein
LEFRHSLQKAASRENTPKIESCEIELFWPLFAVIARGAQNRPILPSAKIGEILCKATNVFSCSEKAVDDSEKMWYYKAAGPDRPDSLNGKEESDHDRYVF